MAGMADFYLRFGDKLQHGIGQIAGVGDDLLQADQRNQDAQNELAKFIERRAAARRQERMDSLAEMDRSRRIEQEDKEQQRKDAEYERAMEFMRLIQEGKKIANADPRLAKSSPRPPTPTREEMAWLEDTSGGTVMPPQGVRGSDSTAMMGQALDNFPGSAADGRMPYTREEIPDLALRMGQMRPSEYMTATRPDPGSRSSMSYRDIEIPEIALPAWDRSLTWYNAARRADPSINQIDLMERFVQEQIGDGLSRDMARQIQTKASSRINQVYGTGIRNPWQAVKNYVDAGKAATEAGELGLDVPGAPRRGTAWSKDTRQGIQSIVDKVKQDYNFKEHTESIAGAQKVLEAQAMAAETPAALAASIVAVARMMAPGVVTDRDFAVLTDYGAPVGVRTWDQVVQWVSGQPPEKKSQVIAGISDILKKAAQRTSGGILNIAYESAQASGLNVNKDQLWQFIAPTSARQYLNMGEQPKVGTGPARTKSADDYLKEAGL